MIPPYQKFLKEIMLTEAQIQARIQELGEEITHAYDEDDDLLLVCILKGGGNVFGGFKSIHSLSLMRLILCLPVVMGSASENQKGLCGLIWM